MSETTPTDRFTVETLIRRSEVRSMDDCLAPDPDDVSYYKEVAETLHALLDERDELEAEVEKLREAVQGMQDLCARADMRRLEDRCAQINDAIRSAQDGGAIANMQEALESTQRELAEARYDTIISRPRGRR